MIRVLTRLNAIERGVNSLLEAEKRREEEWRKLAENDLPYGWVCPLCGCVYSPFVSTCGLHNSWTTTGDSTQGVYGGER
jgi:uncharacterized OB-fold protein